MVSLLTFLWASPHPIKEDLVQVSLSQYRLPLACRSLVSRIQLSLEPWDRGTSQASPWDVVLGPKGNLLPAHVTSLLSQPLRWTHTLVRAERAVLRECCEFGYVWPRLWHYCFLSVHHPSWAFNLCVRFISGQVFCCVPGVPEALS